MSKVLVVAAHPDDEVLGAGGTMAKFADSGHEVYTLILSKGITSRRNPSDDIEKKLLSLENQFFKANEYLGVKQCFQLDFPDNSFDTVPLLDIIQEVEKIKNEIRPDIVFTHHQNDLNIDHQLTYKAVLTSSRSLKTETVKEIYSFEVLSSTEYSYPLTFSPNYFIDISEYVEKKINAMNIYKDELREFNHPRSLQGIKLNAEVWGMKVGVQFAEAFQAIRILK